MKQPGGAKVVLGLPDVLSAVAPYAGLGGISVGAVVWLFRELISRNLFSKLGPQHAFEIIKLVVLCSFLLGAFGIGAWAYTQYLSHKNEEPRPTTVAETKLATPSSSKDAAPPISNEWVEWMGTWTGRRTDNAVFLSLLNGVKCTADLDERYTINFTDRNNTSLSGLLSLEQSEAVGAKGGSSSMNDADALADCRRYALAAEHSLHRIRTYAVTMRKGFLGDRRVSRLVVTSCQLNGNDCPAADWDSAQEIELTKENEERMNLTKSSSGHLDYSVPLHR